MTLLEMIMQKNEGLTLMGSRDLIGELVADRGQDFTPISRPAHIAQGEAKNCFQNATDLSLDSKDNLRYVEGVACSENIPFPIHHAWVIDENDNVIDPTWNKPESCLYRGVVIERELSILAEKPLPSGGGCKAILIGSKLLHRSV